MMRGEDRTAKYAEDAKRAAKLPLKDESYRVQE